MKHIIRLTGIAALAVMAAFVLAVPGYADDEVCAACHEDLAAKMAETAHGLTLRGAPGCQACHGDGTAHAEEGDPEKISVPTGSEGEAACRECHEADLHGSLASRAVHASASVFCFDCHTVHGEAASGRLLTAEPGQLCSSCHPAEARSFDKPFGHRLQGSSMACVSCHDPHAGRGERSLKEDRSGQGPCVTCHAEKRGPFVFPHVGGIYEDCMKCHQPHGSTNPAALTRNRVDQLCLECHSPITGGTLGSMPPSTHDLRFARYRNCTVCHVAIHGSNTSPTLLR